jgi:hypothetical protein
MAMKLMEQKNIKCNRLIACSKQCNLSIVLYIFFISDVTIWWEILSIVLNLWNVSYFHPSVSICMLALVGLILNALPWTRLLLPSIILSGVSYLTPDSVVPVRCLLLIVCYPFMNFKCVFNFREWLLHSENTLVKTLVSLSLHSNAWKHWNLLLFSFN